MYVIRRVERSDELYKADIAGVAFIRLPLEHFRSAQTQRRFTLGGGFAFNISESKQG